MKIPVKVDDSGPQKVPVIVNGAVVENGVARPAAGIVVPATVEEIRRLTVRDETQARER